MTIGIGIWLACGIISCLIVALKLIERLSWRHIPSFIALVLFGLVSLFLVGTELLDRRVAKKQKLAQK